MAPTRSQVDHWDTTRLGNVGKVVAGNVVNIDNAADSMLRTITGMHWSGEAYNAACDRADREDRQMRKVGSAFDRLATACTQGAAAMGPIIDSLKSATRGLESDHFQVGDDWTVTDKLTTTDKSLQQRRAEEATNETVRLQKLAGDLGAADQQCAQAAGDALKDIGLLTPALAGLTGSTAQSDVDDLRTGHPTQAELDRIHAATQLTDQQKRDLAEGRPVDMPQGQYDYLRGLMRAMDGSSVDDISKLASALPADRQGDLANAMQLISNPQVQTASVLHPGDAPSVIDRGGLGQLPTNVRTLLTDNPVTWSKELITQGGVVPPVQSVPRASDFKSVTSLLGHGDPGLAQGSDLDRGLIKQASEIAGATPGKDPVVDVNHNDMNALASDMLDRASTDHVAVTDALTGNNMDVTCGGNHYDPTSHIDGLLNHRWDGHDQGIAKLIDSIGQNATSSDGNLNVPSGRAAYALSQYMGSHQDQLLHLPGRDFEDAPSIGANDPNMTQALQRTLGHYIPNMVGVPDSMVQSHGFGDAAGTNHLGAQDVKAIFKEIDSNHEAAVQFNGSAYSTITQLDYQFGHDGGAHPELGEYASRIDWAAQHAMYDPSAGDGDPQLQTKKDFFDSLKPLVKLGVGEIPVVGSFLNTGIDVTSPEVKTWLLGSVPDAGASVDIHGQGNSPHRYYDIFHGMSDSPQFPNLRHDPNLGQYYRPDGSVMSFDDIVRGTGGTPQFNADMDKSAGTPLQIYQNGWNRGQDAQNWIRK
ncbi:hypothetical protein [Nocardia sp. NPDC051570]|uniref:TPR repeat region-containing protein n=1 Tax=Nocardia sp. NPDC051570 TaxID=3364324 RepID=UPI0037B15114